MDELILSFTPEQYKKYLEILDSAEPSLNFSTSIEPFSPHSRRGVAEAAEKAVEIANKLTSTVKTASGYSVFRVTYTTEESQHIQTEYFTAVREISRLRSLLLGELLSISKSVSVAENIYNAICASYNDFLPYKAALRDNTEYGETVHNADSKFKESISDADSQRERERAFLEATDKICNTIIPEFLNSSSAALDAPSFFEINETALVASVCALTEQIRIALTDK